VKPLWLDDASELETHSNVWAHNFGETLKEIDWNDKHRLHNKEALTEDENLEISLFHSFKQDPFYKHHLRTHLAK
jgi:hypothetical protein